MRRRIRFCLLFCSVVLWGDVGAQNQKPSIGLDTVLPAQECRGVTRQLHVTAERLVYDSQTQTFVFQKNVRVQRCQMTLQCDRLDVTNNIKSEKVERLVAWGNVRIQQGERHVQAERAEYFDAEQKLVLTGNPRVWNAQHQHELSGEEIVVFLEQEKITVKRARVIFHPRQKPSADASER